MGIVLQASPAPAGFAARCMLYRRTVDVRNDQGSTHRVLKEILQYTRRKGCVRFFYFHGGIRGDTVIELSRRIYA